MCVSLERFSGTWEINRLFEKLPWALSKLCLSWPQIFPKPILHNLLLYLCYFVSWEDPSKHGFFIQVFNWVTGLQCRGLYSTMDSILWIIAVTYLWVTESSSFRDLQPDARVKYHWYKKNYLCSDGFPSSSKTRLVHFEFRPPTLEVTLTDDINNEGISLILPTSKIIYLLPNQLFKVRYNLSSMGCLVDHGVHYKTVLSTSHGYMVIYGYLIDLMFQF